MLVTKARRAAQRDRRQGPVPRRRRGRQLAAPRALPRRLRRGRPPRRSCRAGPMCTDNAAMVAAAGWWRLRLRRPQPASTPAPTPTCASRSSRTDRPGLVRRGRRTPRRGRSRSRSATPDGTGAGRRSRRPRPAPRWRQQPSAGRAEQSQPEAALKVHGGRRRARARARPPPPPAAAGCRWPARTTGAGCARWWARRRPTRPAGDGEPAIDLVLDPVDQVVDVVAVAEQHAVLVGIAVAAGVHHHLPGDRSNW